MISTGNHEYVIHEGWARLWQPGLSKKGYRLYLAYAGDGRYLLTTRRLIWFRWFPTSLFNGYGRRIHEGTQVYKENLVELLMENITSYARRKWPGARNEESIRLNL